MSSTLSIEPKYFFGGVSVPVSSDWQRSAVSKEAGVVATSIKKVDDNLENSQVLFGEKAEAISELSSIVAECRFENWDSDGASPIRKRAALLAERFIRVLPEGVPMPEVTPEPDGSVGLEWYQSKRKAFVVSFGSSARLAYSWIDGPDRGHAVIHFDGETIPNRVLADIRIRSHARTPD